jgi:ATP:ADP antiporter, AAA family
MFRAFSSIRPEERRESLSAFLTLFGMMCGHALLETARDALFLANLPVNRLPWVYLGIAVGALFLHRIQEYSLQRFRRGIDLSLALSLAALITLTFWGLADTARWSLYGLYAWSGLFSSVVVVRFWVLMGDLFTVTQAKRLYAFIGIGSVLGAVAGSALARLLAAAYEPRQILLAAAIAVLASGIGPLMLRNLSPGSAEPAVAPRLRTRELLEDLRFIWDRPYVKQLAILVLVSTGTLTVADYIFKSVVARSVPADELGTFFATFYLLLNALSLIAQIVLVSWLVRRLGVSRLLLVFPALLFVGTFGILISGGLLAALFLKGADGSLRYSLHRTSVELLSVPLSFNTRARVKAFIDVVGQRGGQAIASLAILSVTALGGESRVLASVLAALLVAWTAAALGLRGPYTDLFRKTLAESSTPDSPGLPEMNLASLETLIERLNSSDDAEVTAVLELLALEGRTRLIPALILYHPSASVVVLALRLLSESGRTDFLPIADRLLKDRDAEVRAAALKARTRVDPDPALLRSFLDDPSPVVAATSLVALISGGNLAESEAREQLERLIRDDRVEARVALARAVSHHASPLFEEALFELASDPSPTVKQAVAEAISGNRSEHFVEALIPMLADRRLRPHAQAALLSIGTRALPFLDRALGDPWLPRGVRHQLPRTIRRFEPDAAARILMKHLIGVREGMIRFKILRSLGRLHAENPELRLYRSVLREAVAENLRIAFRALDWRLSLERGSQEDPRRVTPTQELLKALLRDKERHAIERIFRLLGMENPGEDFKKIYRGLFSSRPDVRASSRELLEHLTRPPLREALLGILDDVSDVRRLAHSRPFHSPRRTDYEAVLRTLLRSGSESVACLAAHHVGELALRSLTDSLEALRLNSSELLGEVVERALTRLSEARAIGLRHG